jgi:hypothetical protein
MEYKHFHDILNKQIFESSKRDLLEKIAKYPERYIGLFRPTKPKAKILQNLLQSNEIRFGDALEILFEKYFSQLGFTNLPKKIEVEKEYLNFDQLFQDDKYIYFVEQKVRDDHDSTKKRGQFANFEKKINALIHEYDESKLKCFMYFIDPNLTKNKKYYSTEMIKIQFDYNIYVKLCYGKDFWEEIIHPEIWNELLKYLEKWKKEIPDMPSINFDDDAESTFEEIKSIEFSIFRKLFDNKIICKEILPILFPRNESLELLHRYFSLQEKQNNIYKTLSNKIIEYIKLSQ